MLNILEFYNTYSLIIDFLIFTLLFIGIAQATLNKHFPSRGGKAIFIALGLSLATGLVISESKYDFNIGSLGPFAILLIVLLVVLIIYKGIPRDRKTTEEEDPNQKIFPNSQAIFPKEITHKIQQEKQEKAFIEKNLDEPVKESLRLEKQVGRELKEIRRQLKEHKEPEQQRLLAAAKLQALLAENLQINYLLQPLRNNIKRLTTFDYQNFRLLKKKYPLLPKETKKLVKTEIREEWHKLALEKEIAELEEQGKTYLARLKQTIQSGILELNNSHGDKAISLVAEAIKWHKRIKGIIGRIRRLQRLLESYTKKEIRVEKKEVRELKKGYG